MYHITCNNDDQFQMTFSHVLNCTLYNIVNGTHILDEFSFRYLCQMQVHATLAITTATTARHTDCVDCYRNDKVKNWLTETKHNTIPKHNRNDIYTVDLDGASDVFELSRFLCLASCVSMIALGISHGSIKTCPLSNMNSPPFGDFCISVLKSIG